MVVLRATEKWRVRHFCIPTCPFIPSIATRSRKPWSSTKLTWRASRICSRDHGVGPSPPVEQHGTIHLDRARDPVLPIIGVDGTVDVRDGKARRDLSLVDLLTIWFPGAKPGAPNKARLTPSPSRSYWMSRDGWRARTLSTGCRSLSMISRQAAAKTMKNSIALQLTSVVGEATVAGEQEVEAPTFATRSRKRPPKRRSTSARIETDRQRTGAETVHAGLMGSVGDGVTWSGRHAIAGRNVGPNDRSAGGPRERSDET